MRRLLAAEWTKLRSLRSTWISMAAALAVSVAGGVFSASGRAHDWATMSPTQRAELDPVNLSFDGFALAQLAFALLGVLAFTSEYATGLIRTTFIAVPNRLTVLAAKAIVVGGVALLMGEAFSLAAFLSAQRALASQHLGVGLLDDHVLRAVGGAGVYLAALALIGIGLGGLLRHTAAAVSSVFALVLVVPILAPGAAAWTTVPETWNLWAAGNALITTLPPTEHQPSAWLGLVICGVHAAVLLCAATVVLTRRDA